MLMIVVGMGKEVENLIAENNELLATKNALNIVKDDLISKVDELTGYVLVHYNVIIWLIILQPFVCACSEHEILREEIKSLQFIRARLENKVIDLEEELKKTKEDAENAAKSGK